MLRLLPIWPNFYSACILTIFSFVFFQALEDDFAYQLEEQERHYGPYLNSALSAEAAAAEVRKYYYLFSLIANFPVSQILREINSCISQRFAFLISFKIRLTRKLISRIFRVATQPLPQRGVAPNLPEKPPQNHPGPKGPPGLGPLENHPWMIWWLPSTAHPQVGQQVPTIGTVGATCIVDRDAFQPLDIVWPREAQICDFCPKSIQKKKKKFRKVIWRENYKFT